MSTPCGVVIVTLLVPLPSSAALLMAVPAIVTAATGSSPSGVLIVKLPVVVWSSRTLRSPASALTSGIVIVTRSLLPVSVTVSVVLLASPSASVRV